MQLPSIQFPRHTIQSPNLVEAALNYPILLTSLRASIPAVGLLGGPLSNHISRGDTFRYSRRNTVA